MKKILNPKDEKFLRLPNIPGYNYTVEVKTGYNPALIHPEGRKIRDITQAELRIIMLRNGETDDNSD